MKNPTRQLLTGILLTLALGGTLAACGGDDTATKANGSADSNGAATNQTASASEVDQAFVRQMVPHHLMAVIMARSALKQADHAELRTLATAIIDAQEEEITELQAIGKDLGASADHSSMMDDDAQALGLSMDEMGMSMDMNALDGSDDFDRDFVDEMTVHHEGAIAMAKAELAKGSDARLKTIAKGIITAQEKEIAQMAAWRADWFGSSKAPATPDDGDHAMSHMS